MLEKADWIRRFATRLMGLQPLERCANMPQIAETFWYYTRHRCPEEAAQARAAGTLPALDRERAWIEACSHAIQAHDPQLSEQDTRSLAERLWDADSARTVDPYVMAEALWDQAILMSLDLKCTANAANVPRSGPRH